MTCNQAGNFYDMENCFWRNETRYQSYYEMKALGYLDLACCLFVIISNAIIIMVFSRNSRTTSMNRIFTHMAITESLAGLSFSPRAWQEFIRVKECAIQQHRTFFWEVISINFYRIAFALRHVGVWQALMLAVWRYIAVIHPLKERSWCNPEITGKFIKLGYLFGAITMLPIFFGLKVGSTKKLIDKNGCSTSNYTNASCTEIHELQVPMENYPVLYITAISFFSLLKLLPSVAFTFIIYRLIIRLIEVKKQRNSMIGHRLNRNTIRTTISLVLILTLFVIGEVPQGIFCILIAYHGPAFFWRSYYFHGFEICNTITHLSESFNFVIYYAMNQQFREAFYTLVSRNNSISSNINTSNRIFVSCSHKINKSCDVSNSTNSTAASKQLQ